MSPTVLMNSGLVKIAEELARRIRERFPEARLAGQADELVRIVQESPRIARKLSRRGHLFRFVVGLLIAAVAAAAGYALYQSKVQFKLPTAVNELLQIGDSGCQLLIVFGGASIWMLSSSDRRKARRWNREIAKLRSFAHVVDLRQLDKDPDRLQRDKKQNTLSSPKVEPYIGTAFLMTRYLDYCGEMLAVIGNVAAYYAQFTEDEDVLSTVNDVEGFTNQVRLIIQGKTTTLAPMVATELANPKAEAAPVEAA